MGPLSSRHSSVTRRNPRSPGWDLVGRLLVLAWVLFAFLLHHLFELCLCFGFCFCFCWGKNVLVSISNCLAKGLVNGIKSLICKYSTQKGLQLMVLKGGKIALPSQDSKTQKGKEKKKPKHFIIEWLKPAMSPASSPASVNLSRSLDNESAPF